ncbi:MAG: FAD binding domain-containing protein [Gemmatimonadota bacterium]|nr:FAD binding domain-containing protein [Gemmatimonadota bacterium]MDE2871122.1 FAD binding domain-containing protein [Gemmatimonadota bacterium]
MLRLPPFRYHRPDTVDEAVLLLARFGEDALPIAGGTDLMPNMKHRLFTPAHVVSLNGIAAMRGIGTVAGTATGSASDNGSAPRGNGFLLRIGALETLADVSGDPLVRRHCAGLAEAAGLVAGPQLRNMGTIGGNVCLDTRCTYYNQTEFWREALGYCLKKDGTVCHVTKVGRKCVAAHSADTPPNLIALDASLTLAGPDGTREISAAEFFVTDGIRNTRRKRDEILTEIRIPIVEGRRSAYRKLRQRHSIDFPLLSVAVVADFAEDETLTGLTGAVSALGARPRVLAGWRDMATGERMSRELIEALAGRAWSQCRPLDNIIVDPEWRRAMVPVYVRRALEEVAGGGGPGSPWTESPRHSSGDASGPDAGPSHGKPSR